MNYTMEHYADLLLPMVRNLELKMLTPVYPEAYAQLLVIEGNLHLSVETSSNPLLISEYTILFAKELENDDWKDKIEGRIKDKFLLLINWKNGQTMQ